MCAYILSAAIVAALAALVVHLHRLAARCPRCGASVEFEPRGGAWDERCRACGWAQTVDDDFRVW